MAPLMPSYDPPPRGLVLFASSEGRDRAQRRARIVYVLVVVAVTLGVIWPIYPWAAARLPSLLGLPPSLVWVIAAVVAIFFATAGLFALDRASQRGPGSGRPGVERPGADGSGASDEFRGEA
ncbi:MAG: hypothetical protein AAGD01_15990 [Acidobacteriota bacterium]